jgi:hypothetical protein
LFLSMRSHVSCSSRSINHVCNSLPLIWV